MELLEGIIRHYDWGSVSSIPALLGRPEDGRPWAELWLGAHPSGPSSVGADARPLDVVVGEDPVAALGSEVAQQFGSLPFLLKILAAAAPLSLQAHPSIPQAEAGYDREEAVGIALDAPHRSFRDRHHKPELICALTEFDALCGFRHPDQTLAVLATIETPALDPVRAALAVEPSGAGLRAILCTLLTMEADAAREFVDSVVGACAADGPTFAAGERAMAAALGQRYPGDAGVVTALLLNFVRLAPNEALFLGPGNLHAYLNGTGVEVMANSDNVLRGGLTPKHVDVETLLEVVDVVPIVPDVQRPPVVNGVASYSIPVPEFSLKRIIVDGSAVVEGGPAIILCTEGVAAAAGGQTLPRGTAAWLAASHGSLEVHGQATLFVASCRDH